MQRALLQGYCTAEAYWWPPERTALDVLQAIQPEQVRSEIKGRGCRVEKKLHKRSEQYFQTIVPPRAEKNQKMDALHNFSLEMHKALLKQL